jgi:hypothetical protein
MHGGRSVTRSAGRARQAIALETRKLSRNIAGKVLVNVSVQFQQG